MRIRSIPRVGSALGVALLAGSMVGAALAATPPVRPASGPGSLAEPQAEVVKRAVGRASAATYAFHLAAAPSRPRSVIVLLHGWGAINPAAYGGWIDHLARQGHLVLFPAFQEVGKTRPVDAAERAAGLVKEALETLASDPQAQPDTSRLAYLGHSAGAGVGIDLAATATARSLPVPRLVFMIMPGGIASDEKSRGIQLADLTAISPNTTLVAMVGDREFQAADRVSRRILREATAVPPARKLLLKAGSDDHGFPSLSATLASPGSSMEAYDSAPIKVPPDPPVDPKAPKPPRPKWSADMVLTGEQTVLVAQLQRNPTDALDYLAYWRTFDMIAAATLGGGDLAALKADPSFLDMGRWSDGWPVRRLGAETPKETTTPPVARAAMPATKLPVTRQRDGRRRR